MTNHRYRRVLACGLAAAVALTACSAEQEPDAPIGAGAPASGCPSDTARPLTLVVGARMGSPVPSLPPETAAMIESAVAQSQRLQVVRIDGQPTVALNTDVRITSKNDDRKGREIAGHVQGVTNFVTGLKPKQPEANVLGALSEAGRVTPEGGTIVLLDSGLATSGALSYRDESMFDVLPSDVAAYLKAQSQLPDLKGRSVVLVGLGGTAEPQAELDNALRSRVVELWKTVVSASGAACVDSVGIASRRNALDTTVPVTQIPLPKPTEIKPCGTTVLRDSDSVGFVPDKADLRDRGAAESTLQQLVDQVSSGKQQILLVGNTATVGPEQGLRDLSKARAETVKSILVAKGVAAGRITTRGDGASGPHHENDLGPGGVLLPGPAAKNRSVVVTLSCQS